MKLEENIQYLDMIRDRIDTLIAKGHIRKIPENFIADNLARACGDGKRFTVKYIKLPPSEKTFIMCCYPDLAELNDKSKVLLEHIRESRTGSLLSTWHSITRWHIEIDERLLCEGTPITVDNGSQFVAILCHELGHILNSFPAALVLNYKVNVAKANIFNKVLMSNAGRVILKLCLPMFVCINGLRIIVSKPGSDLNEMMADAKVPNAYKKYLIDYAENHIMTNPETASGIVVTPQEYDHEQEVGIEFTRSCISLMKQRSLLLKLHLSTFGTLSSSEYLAGMAKFIADNIDPDDVHQNYVVKEAFNHDWTISVEAAEQKLVQMCESTNVSERDLLMLQVDIDGMETLDDKAYVLNTICDFLEILQKKREKEVKKAKDITKAPMIALYDEKIKRLNDMKAQVLSTKISSYTNGKEYAVYIKYPDGYEG